MKAAPLLISWHNESQPIYSVHFDPHGKGRLATAGGDNNIRLWSLERDGEEAKVSFLATLVRHTQTVNVVRFCPKGEMLASAGDDGNVLLWVPSDMPATALGEDHAEDKETWRIKHMCRTSTGAEIYDLAWSPDGRYFITGAMDNTARIFDSHSGAMIRQIAEHNHYVQGVAWDPLNEFVATQSSDRTVHIYALKLKDGTCTLHAHGKFNKMDLPGRRVSTQSPAPVDTTHRASSASASGLAIASPAPSNPGTPMTTPLPMDPPMTASSRRSSFGSHTSPAVRRSASPAPSLPLPAVRPEVSSPSLNAAMGLAVRNTNIYHNETLTSFFRRLTFAPDGSLLFTPSGQYKQHHPLALDSMKTNEDITNTVYIYTRAGFNKPPVAHLPGHKKASVAVRCSPIFYTLRNHVKPTNQITIDTSSQAEAIPPLPEAAVTSQPSFMEPPPLTHSESMKSESRPTSSPKPPEPDNNPPSAFSLPYRMVYAVATQDAVLVYDTQQTIPLCVVSNLHYATFTDLAWSNDGLTLMMSSSDGFCSTLTFASGELGTVYAGPHPTHKHPEPIHVSSTLPTPFSSTNTPTIPSPGLAKASPAFIPPAVPSPAASNTSFQVRPGSPTRSNSQSSVATLASMQASAHGNNPTPMMSSIPSVAVPPMTTPPQTPMGTGGPQLGHHSAASSISGSVLGKRDPGAASESEKEEAQPKRRRIAPTLVPQRSARSESQSSTGEAGSGLEKKN
ncbi:Chromatin assembly factor 1 subunit [Knufia obscura]|uniref:Chromatin assembly factor 1 subunit n=1 Tax=Knufia obscura TaxID=1635080 RepID=A0ABR0RQV9_9EURO|nr:Chromatin assembly factor 1 subunit [Knufia obscura]